MSFRSPTEIPPRLPPDRGRLLDSLQKQMLERVLPALDRALGKVDDYLFDRSQQGDEEFGLMVRELRRQRGQIARRYEDVVQAGFRNLRSASEWFPADGRSSDLSLLSEQELEEQLAVEQLADALVRVHGPGVEDRQAHCPHCRPRGLCQAQDNPLAPAFLAAALRTRPGPVRAGSRRAHRGVQVLRTRTRGGAGCRLYERANTLMIAAGVFPSCVRRSRPQRNRRRRRVPRIRMPRKHRQARCSCPPR